MTERQKAMHQEMTLAERAANDYLDKHLFEVLSGFNLDPGTFAAICGKSIGRFIAILDEQIQEKPETVARYYDVERMKAEGRVFPVNMLHDTFKANVQEGRREYHEEERPSRKKAEAERAELRKALHEGVTIASGADISKLFDALEEGDPKKFIEKLRNLGARPSGKRN